MHLIEKIPYHTTKITIEQTQADAITLLRKYNISGYQWTTYQGKSALKFILEGTPYMIDVPKIQAIKKSKYQEKIVEVPEEVCFRIFYWSLKSILEVNTFGVFEQLLLPYQIIKTSEGFKTIGDSIKDSPNYLLPEGEETF